MKQHEMNKNLSLGVTTPNDYIVCEVCDKIFVSQRFLSTHRRLVHQVAQCSKCGETVPLLKLNYHMKMRHKEGKPLPCPHPNCSKIFYLSSILRGHIKDVHKNSKPKQLAKCHICFKEFKRAGMLLNHLKTTHQITVNSLQNPPTYICSECGNRYGTKGTLDRHMDAKHPEKSEKKWHIKCKLCSRTFWNKNLLTSHLAEAHPSEAPSTT